MKDETARIMAEAKYYYEQRLALEEECRLLDEELEQVRTENLVKEAEYYARRAWMRG